MDYSALIADIFQVILIPLLGILVGYFVKWINHKSEELSANTDNIYAKKYISLLNETIVSSVIAVNQTYVDALKAQGVFDKEAQEKAFLMVYNTVIATLTEEGKKYLNEAIGDLNAYITAQIEAQVKIQKTPAAAA